MNKSRRINLGVTLALMSVMALSILIRMPASQSDGFHNEDAAGILYSAQLINQGGLPLIDTLELKAPGSFFLTAVFWRIFPESIVAVQTLGIVWSILAMLGIYAGGRALFDSKAGLISATAYMLLSPIMDSMDINYGAWMITPMIWSMVCFIKWIGTERRAWLFMAGVLLAFAGLLKRQGAVLTPLFLCGIGYLCYARYKDAFVGHFGRNTSVFLGGILIGFLPIFVFYLFNGSLLAFMEHYFFSPGGWKYLDTLSWDEKSVRLADGALGFLEYGSVASVLAMVSLIGWVGQDEDRHRASWYLLLGFLLVSILGLSLGFRFFKGYYLQTLPALVWMMGAPSGISKLFTAQMTWPKRSAIGLLSLLVLSPFVVKDAKAIQSIRQMRKQPRDMAAQRIAALIKKETKPEEKIWVWGRAAWPVYVHADRLAATRYPKTLAVFTTNLTNTWRRGTKPTTFEPRSDWKTLIQELKRDKPSFIVLAHNERYGKFKALHAVLRQYYQKRTSPSRGFSVYALRR